MEHKYEFDFRPPSNNTYYRKFRNMMVLSEKGRKFKEDVQWIILSEGTPKKIIGDVKVKIEVFYKARPCDVDNIPKGILDSVKDMLMEDDANVSELHIVRHTKQEKDRFIITITKL